MADLDNLAASDSVKIAGANPTTGVESFFARVSTQGGLHSRPDEWPTFFVFAPAVILGNNKSMIAIQASGALPAGTKIKLQEVRLINTRTAATTGVAASFEFRRITSFTGGTALNILAADTDDVAPAAVTAATGATVTEEAASSFMRWIWSSDEWGPGTADVESFDHAIQQIIPIWNRPTPVAKPITLNAGQGLHIRCATNTTNGEFDILFTFTVET